jgi:3-hydroxyacyl-CoA dehydrogenase
MTASSEWVTSKTGNKTAVVSLHRPPEGTFFPALRAAFLAALQDALDNPEVDTIVLTSNGGGFTLDLPLPEHQLGEANPTLATLTEAIATAQKPVVAALRGRAADAGLELALAAAARVAHLGTRISLPSLHAARLPSPAALYTLAARLGPDLTRHFLETPSDMSVSHPQLEPLFDKIVSQNAVGEAAEHARSLAPCAALPQPAFDNPVNYQNQITALRSTTHFGAYSADKAALATVLEAALLLPREATLKFAQTQIEDLAENLSSKRKGYRRAAKLAAFCAFPEAQAPEALTLVGTGTQAARIALSAMRAQLPVRVLALEGDDFAAFREAIKAQINTRTAKRQIAPGQARPMLALLSELPDFTALKTADWIVEAAARSIDTIGGLIAQIKGAASEEAVIMLTSAMRSGAGEFAEVLAPRVAALQFHADVGSGELAEIALKPELARTDRHRAPMVAALRRIGVTPVFQAAQNGLASSRLFTALCLAAEEAIACGASPEAVDAALPCRVKPFAAQNAEGFRAQPFRVTAFFGDLVKSTAPGLNAALLKAGIEGGKGASALVSGCLSPEADQTLSDWREHVGHQASNTPDSAAITTLATAALLHTGTQLLRDGTIQYPWEIDLIVISSLGFAPNYGGAFFEAEAMGLTRFRSVLAALAPLRPEFFSAPEELDNIIKNGFKFAKPGQTGLAYV